MALLVAQRDGRVLVAVRCLPAASARCPTWVGVFDTGGRLLHGRFTSPQQSGATRCRRMVSGPLHEAHQGDLSLLIQHLCQTFSRPVGRLRGAVRIDGAAGSRLRIIVGDQTVTTDRAGWFSADFGAVGNVRVRLDTNHASGVGRRRCFMTRDERVELPEDGREAHVLVDIETFLPRFSPIFLEIGSSGLQPHCQPRSRPRRHPRLDRHAPSG